jgi:hypothetical protein
MIPGGHRPGRPSADQSGERFQPTNRGEQCWRRSADDSVKGRHVDIEPGANAVMKLLASGICARRQRHVERTSTGELVRAVCLDAPRFGPCVLRRACCPGVHPTRRHCPDAPQDLVAAVAAAKDIAFGSHLFGSRGRMAAVIATSGRRRCRLQGAPAVLLLIEAI